MTFTLDEYLAKRNAARSNLDAFVAVKERIVEATVDGVKVDNALGDYFANGSLKENKKSKETKAKTVLPVEFTAAGADKPQGRDSDRGDTKRLGRDNGRSSGKSQRNLYKFNIYLTLLFFVIFPPLSMQRKLI